MKKVKICIGILLLAVAAISCQHARLRIAQPLPKSCQISDVKNCENDKLLLLNQNNVSVKKTFEVHQKYYIGGLFPRQYEINESKFCPDSGIYEILQYYTFKDALLEQLTAFIYSPRTVRITCY